MRSSTVGAPVEPIAHGWHYSAVLHFLKCCTLNLAHCRTKPVQLSYGLKERKKERKERARFESLQKKTPLKSDCSAIFTLHAVVHWLVPGKDPTRLSMLARGCKVCCAMPPGAYVSWLSGALTVKVAQGPVTEMHGGDLAAVTLRPYGCNWRMLISSFLAISLWIEVSDAQLSKQFVATKKKAIRWMYICMTYLFEKCWQHCNELWRFFFQASF